MRINKKAAAVAVAAVTLAGSGIAYAYWTSAGGGTGTASTAAGNAAAFSVEGDVPAAMYPGDSEQTVSAVVTNDGDENYKLQNLTAWVTTDKSGCDGDD